MPVGVEPSAAGWEQARRVACVVMFIELNGGDWAPHPPDVDEAEAAMLAVAGHEVDEAWFASWLRERVHFSQQ